MSLMSLKVGIAGSGYAARFHFEALRRVHETGIDVVGVYSPTQINRDAFAEATGVRAFASLEALLSEIDVLHICAPPSAHEPLTVAALDHGVHVILEKPFTGYFGPDDRDDAEPSPRTAGRAGASGNDEPPPFSGDTFDRSHGLDAALASVRRMVDAERASDATIFYAENWIYAPAVQKEASILRAAGGQILWMLGVTGHSGSHSPTYGVWRLSGGGSLMGKGVHPLSAVLYLKGVEGRSRDDAPIRPASVSARTHALTRMERFDDRGHIRASYSDIEDFAAVHIVFEDGTCADIFGTEVILGGVTNTLEVHATTHRARCNLNPNTALETFNPDGAAFADVYVVEKIGTKEGWAPTSPDEAWFTGYQHELNAFYADIRDGRAPESGSQLGADTIATVYAAYLSAERGGAEVPVTLIGER